MIDEHDVREMLRRRASTVSTTEVDAPRATRRARRRLLANGAFAVLATAAIAGATFAGVQAVRTAPVPADDRSEELGIFAPVAGRIVFQDERGVWAVDPNGPVDTEEGPGVADDVASTLVPLELDGTPLAWSSDGTELLLMRSDGHEPYPQQYLSILHTDGSETQVTEHPMYIDDATISPDATRVAFAVHSFPAEDPGLYVVDAEGGQPVQVSQEGYSPTFSPDGTQIAYLLGGQVWVADVDGSNAHEILAEDATALGAATGMQWSPASDRIALGAGASKGAEALAIYTFAPDGSDFTRVITGGESPYWSPDGTQIAYTIPCEEQPTDSCPEGSILRSQYEAQPDLFGGGSAGLAIADADGSNVREFGYAVSGPWHPAASVQVDEPAPTPGEDFARANGEVLSFIGVPSEMAGDLEAVDPETGQERVLVADLDTVYSAGWSADGRWVAYEVPGSEGTELWVVGASREPRQVAVGGSMLGWSSTGARLATIRPTAPLHINFAGSTLSTTDPASGETTDVGAIPEGVGDVTSPPAWSPDGTRFVFGARGGAIYSLDARSGASSLLVQLPGEHLDSVDRIAWSPDGAHIAVMNDLEPGDGRLYVMDADGSNVRVLLDHGSESIAWSPDGTRLAYTDYTDEGLLIWVASMDDPAATEIGGPLTSPCVLLCSEDLVWSPDGSQIGSRFTGDASVALSAIDADGQGEAERIAELTYRSWDGGSYDCGCV